MLFSEICGSTHPILDFEAKLLAWDTFTPQLRRLIISNDDFDW
jgi:hypothetical protein